jgi:hypothetical protein
MTDTGPENSGRGDLADKLVGGPLLGRTVHRPAALAIVISSSWPPQRWRVADISNKTGLEYTLMWLAALYFLVHGGGAISADHLRSDASSDRPSVQGGWKASAGFTTMSYQRARSRRHALCRPAGQWRSCSEHPCQGHEQHAGDVIRGVAGARRPCGGLSAGRPARLGRRHLQSLLHARAGRRSKIPDEAHELLWTEVTASNLVKVDMDEDLDERAGVNRPALRCTAASCVGGPMSIARCMCTRIGMAIAGLKSGLRMISQEVRFHDRIGYHPYEGITEDFSERERLIAISATIAP